MGLYDAFQQMTEPGMRQQRDEMLELKKTAWACLGRELPLTMGWIAPKQYDVPRKIWAG